jgi:phenylpyruvate tautomerase PptA (4-oxalocrotonate tautomerase family)
MPITRVNCPKGARTSDQKATRAPAGAGLTRQEIDPLTETGTAATGFFFNEFEVENWRPGEVSPSEHPDKVLSI